MKKMFGKKNSGSWQDDRKRANAGGKKFGTRAPWQRDNDRDERPMMHPATCSQCGAQCEVPFRPTGAKPVYCRDCFRKDEGGGSRSVRFDKPAYRSAPRAGEDDVAKQLKALNAKMDQILEALAEIGDEEEEEEEG